jgi:hypothetical protein
MSHLYPDTHPLGALPLCRPRPYQHASLRHDARIQQLDRDDLQRLRDRIEAAIRQGDKLTWAQDRAVRDGVLAGKQEDAQ